MRPMAMGSIIIVVVVVVVACLFPYECWAQRRRRQIEWESLATRRVVVTVHAATTHALPSKPDPVPPGRISA